MKPERIQRAGRLAAAALLLAFGAAVTGLVLLPAHRADQRIAAFGGAIAMLESTEASLTSLEDEVSRLREELAAAESLLPDAQGIDAFVDRVGAAALDAGVRVESVVPGDVETDPDARYSRLRLELRTAGTYPALHRFLGAVEALPQLTRVEGVKLAGDAERCAAEIVLALYYARGEEEG